MERRAFLAAGVAAACRCALGQERPTCARCGGSGEITCEQCKGQWKNVRVKVKCERKGGVGCDGLGYRDCFTCRGTGEVACARCGGTGRITKCDRKGQIVLREWQEDCPECVTARRQSTRTSWESRLPKGRAPCRKCRPLWQCTACEKMYEHQPEFCPCTKPAGWDGQGKTTIIEVHGKIICPRCRGTGEREERVARCPYCREGRQRCPACQGARKG